MDEKEYIINFFKSSIMNYKDLLNDRIYQNIKNSKSKSFRKVRPFTLNIYSKTEFERVLDSFLTIEHVFLIEKKSEEYNREYNKFILSHLFIMCDVISKKLFKNTKFCDMLYNNFLVKYLLVNEEFIRGHVTNHIDLQALIEPLFTGLIMFLKSKEYEHISDKLFHSCFKECNSKIKIKGLYINTRNHIGNITDIFEENSIYTNMHTTQCISGIDYKNIFWDTIFKEAFLHILYCSLFCIVDNFHEYFVLRKIINDCEMSMVSDSKASKCTLRDFSNLKDKLNTLEKNFQNDSNYKLKFSELVDSTIYRITLGDKKIKAKTTEVIQKYNLSHDTLITSTIFTEFIYDSGLYVNLIENIKWASNNLDTFFNYDIKSHFRDIIKVDPLYLFFMNECINVRTLEDYYGK